VTASHSLGRQWHAIPSPPGTAPIPEGHVRLFHYTHPDNVESIARHGLRLDSAKGESYGEPNLVWASAGVPRDDAFHMKPHVEFHAHPSELDIGRGWEPSELEGRGAHVTFRGSVDPSRIVGIHEPWHQAVHHLESSSSSREYWTTGEAKDEWTGDERSDKALAYIRAKHARGEYGS
jgi:hypothetical protein